MYSDTGIIRTIDPQRRLTIPSQFIKDLHLTSTDEVKIYLHHGRIILEPLRNKCIFCGDEATEIYHNKPLCATCIAKIKNS